MFCFEQLLLSLRYDFKYYLLQNVYKEPGKVLISIKGKHFSFFFHLQSVPVRNYKEIEKLMESGTINRTTASTNMHATSSRSHMVITIRFEQVSSTGSSINPFPHTNTFWRIWSRQLLKSLWQKKKEQFLHLPQ